jgi:hypothetical protein
MRRARLTHARAARRSAIRTRARKSGKEAAVNDCRELPVSFDPRIEQHLKASEQHASPGQRAALFRSAPPLRLLYGLNLRYYRRFDQALARTA